MQRKLVNSCSWKNVVACRIVLSDTVAMIVQALILLKTNEDNLREKYMT